MIPKEQPKLSKNPAINPKELKEECGIFGIYSSRDISTFSLAEFGMFALQHRGQEACGVSVLKNGEIHTQKKEGLVLDMFKEIENPEYFKGNAAIGHTRYTTAGDGSTKNIQPLYAINRYGKPYFSIVHNGNLVDCEDLRQELKDAELPFMATSDSEVILRAIQRYAQDPLEEAIKKATQEFRGAYSVLVLTDKHMAAFRDPNGIRPLCMGMIKDDVYVFSSETCGLDAVGARYIREVEPGELIIVDENGLRTYSLTDKSEGCSCSFEYIYFARPDSEMEGKSIYDVRFQSGVKLYEQNPVQADIVIGIPDSGIPAAMGYSQASGMPYSPVLVKNRYMSRSFIVPSQKMRERVVNLKLNPILSKIKGQSIVILDDSIVRGTTSKRLVKILKDAGAKEIHFRSASPAIIAPCFLGIDTPDKESLISANMDVEELREYLGVNSLDFLSIENLQVILGGKNHCFGCFTENYPVRPK